MTFVQPLVGLLAALVVAAAGWLAWRAGRRRTNVRTAATVANVHQAMAAPAFSRRIAQYRRGLAVEAAVAGVVVVGGLLLVMRPVAEIDDPRHTASRDIMLCLDVSGSMMKLDAGLVEAFGRLTRRLDGDRIGLTLFDSTAVTVFPLTDDHRFVNEQLSIAGAALDRFDFAYTAGTYGAQGSSLIGDGLASCAARFDRLDEARPRSIVLATDNQLNGTPVMTLAEAAAEAERAGIAVYTVALRSRGTDAGLAELEAVATGSGGLAFTLLDNSALDEIGERIHQREAAELDQLGMRRRTDRSAGLAVLAIAGSLALIGAGWVIRR